MTIAITMAVRDMLRKRIEAFSLDVFSCGKECRDELTGRSVQCQSRIDTIHAQIEDAQTKMPIIGSAFDLPRKVHAIDLDRDGSS